MVQKEGFSMNTFTVKSSQVKVIINATFPEYRKRKVCIEVTRTVKFYDLNWSGGTKNTYRACTVNGNLIPSKVNMNSPAPWNNQFEGREVEIPKNVVVVCFSYFCGQIVTMTIHVHPDNVPAQLTGSSK